MKIIPWEKLVHSWENFSFIYLEIKWVRPDGSRKVLISENELYFERSAPNQFKGGILVLSIITVAAAFLLSRQYFINQLLSQRSHYKNKKPTKIIGCNQTRSRLMITPSLLDDKWLNKYLYLRFFHNCLTVNIRKTKY